jgi:flagellar basal-body rod protein FlgB
MRPDDVSVLAVLRESIGFLSDRQRVIAENVANANTPGYVAQDLNETEFHRALQAELRSNRANIGAGQGAGLSASRGSEDRLWSVMDSPDSETTVNGNSVVVEEQMVKASETRMRYETALSLYQKSLGLMRMAIRPPAR